MKTYETFREELLDYMEANGKTIEEKEIIEKYNDYKKHTGEEEKPVKVKKVKKKTETPEIYKKVSEALREYKEAVAEKKKDPSDENKKKVSEAFKKMQTLREEKKKWKNDNS